ncbi:MAG: hypothetical protein GKR94_03440 [Gammaproteobacteria bacterium]|nr:hypothetical protein [Gammaproteobacteria bacterium]
MLQSGVAFIISNIQVKNYEPVELIDDHVFRKARGSEVDTIREKLKDITIYAPFINEELIYDTVILEEKYKKHTKYHRNLLPEEERKYWVIAYNGNNQCMSNLEDSVSLLENSFDIGFHLLYNEPNQEGDTVGMMSSEGWVAKYRYTERNNANAIEVGIDEIKRIQNITAVP